MKTLSAIALTLLLSIGCSKKDDPAAAAPSLVGTWVQTKYERTGFTAGLALGNVVENPCTFCSTDVLGSSSYSSVSTESVIVGTYTTSGTQITVSGTITSTFSGSTDPINFTNDYAVTATTLTITVNETTYCPTCKAILTYTRQ